MSPLYSRQLEYFLAVFEAGSFRKAAETAGVTQPALTRSLKGLEEQLQVLLFERRSSGVLPTEAGEVLHRHAMQIANDSRYAEMEIGALRDGHAGVLRIGAGLVWSLTHMPTVLAEFHQRFPAVNLELITGITDMLQPRLYSGDIDILVTELRGDEVPGEFEVCHSWSTEMAPFARADHPLFRRGTIGLDDILTYDWAGFAADARFTRSAANYFQSRGLSAPVISMTMTSLATMLSVVRVSDHIAVIARALRGEAMGRNLVEVPLSEPLWTLETAVVFRRQVMLPEPARYLIAQLSEIDAA